MAQLDVHRLRSGELVLDCQADIVSRIIHTRLVVPLLDPDSVPDAMKQLHPVFQVGGKAMLMLTHLASAVPARDLSKPIESLESERYAIIKAIDFLTTGV